MVEKLADWKVDDLELSMEVKKGSKALMTVEMWAQLE